MYDNKLSLSEIERLMLPQIHEIVDAWNDEQIIFEGQFTFASEGIIKRNLPEIIDVLLKYGADIPEADEEYGTVPIHAVAYEVEGGSWMYAFHAYTGKLETNADVEKAILDHYREQ